MILNIINKIKYYVTRQISFFYKKKIIVFAGYNSILLCAYIGSEIIEYLILEKDSNSSINYQKFFSKFQNFNIYFLLDTSNSSIREELIPFLQSIIKNNPIEEFIASYFTSNEIVAYDIFAVTKDDNIAHSIIVSTSYDGAFIEILEYSQEHLNFSGIYFLVLELRTTIDKLIDEPFDSKNLQIFVTNLKISGLKILCKHNDHLLTFDNFEYPYDKSENYIAGFIHQQVKNKLEQLNNYIINHNLKIIIFFIVDNNIEPILQIMDFNGHKLKFTHQVNSSLSKDSSEILDIKILKLLNQKWEFLAFNQHLLQLNRLNILNFLLTKPLIIAILMLCVSVIFNRIESLQTYKKLNEIHRKKYDLLQEYNNLKSKNLSINYIPNLANLHVMEEMLTMTMSTPFTLLDKVLLNLDNNFIIREINWSRANIDNILLVSNQYITIKITLNFITNNLSTDESIKLLKDFDFKLEHLFPEKNIQILVFSEHIIELPNKLIIPIDIVLKDFSPLNPNYHPLSTLDDYMN
jgi:hypothetical protein